MMLCDKKNIDSLHQKVLVEFCESCYQLQMNLWLYIHSVLEDWEDLLEICWLHNEVYLLCQQLVEKMVILKIACESMGVHAVPICAKLGPISVFPS